MSDAVGMQADIGSLSLASLGPFSTILTALSADDVQPMALLQLQDLGAAFPVSGPVTVKIPEHLQRFHSTRVERLGIIVGWRKGDSTSLLAQSIGGQAIALLAVCLCNIQRQSVGHVFHAISKALLPRSVCLSSPSILQRAVEVLADKLALIGFGTIIANQVCRIHEAYTTLQQKVPINLLEELNEGWVAEMLVNISYALREDEGIMQIRGCCGMGYILALVITLFADDCTVTIEGLIIHQGKNSASIIVDIVAFMEEQPVQIHRMHKIDCVAEIFHTSRASESGSRWGIGNGGNPLSPVGADFQWNGLISALLHTIFQKWNLVCPVDVVEAVGICALSAGDVTCVFAGDGLKENHFSITRLLGENHRSIMHKRCEYVIGIQLPYTWPIYSEAFEMLHKAIVRLIQNAPKSSSHRLVWPPNAAKEDNTFGSQVVDVIWFTFIALFINPHENATWRPECFASRCVPKWPDTEVEDDFTWGMQTDSDYPWMFYEFDWLNFFCDWHHDTIASSDRKVTLVPSPCLTLGYENLCYYRGMELLDGPLIYNSRYHKTVESVRSSVEPQDNRLLQPPKSLNPILPTAEGAHSDLLFTISETWYGLALNTTVTLFGRRVNINFANCLSGLLSLIQTEPCEHPRKTPLKKEYSRLVMTTSVLAPESQVESDPIISIVQTAGNPTAQLLSLSRTPSRKWQILCYHCCLNCAYEQALFNEITKIIVA
ncbi:hypothetical protein N7471_005250 [Penicillium samsonianum]|uniref:uncharacterized protein n=1 Tax=Penicillium samsonianum TaxID=1882272 RepID=UPI002549443D|nr:uncharacterized protein N7471_005250 [Penicillium samsonianum]KAJ6138764.1 hypothetical protein N7471_005250 [Penicillium samsonianum]